ncbi:MAG: tRNA (adenosine(37)-N6)-dimethylallyltransferase MiaA [Flavobacteriaceae bacterium]|nr:tRNA (adenosine(37)-N6)-dimethylallyltransferase MiaA [Flavobacteriaceae bacterium]
MSNKNLIYIAGPTGIGKTNIAIKVAIALSTEIISCDSRQFYTEMTIGTAVPSKKELDLVKHHFIQDRSINRPLNISTFQKESTKRIDEIFKNNNNVVMVGGSGLYADSVLFGIDEFPQISDSTVNKLYNTYYEEGIEVLQKKLKEKDYQTYKSIDLNNHRRLVRVLSVCIDANEKYSTFIGRKKEKKRFDSNIYIVNDDRKIIYDKINNRVDNMIVSGLEKEAKSLIKYKNSKIFETVGYKEWLPYWNGKSGKSVIIENIKKNTRRYAKRQITWIKKYKNATWLKPKEAILKIIGNHK